MRVTTWSEYSLIIVLHLARRMSEGADTIAARELSEAERLPGDYVEQIMLRLRRAGIVESMRGARGGYRLARPASAISVRDVMAASEHQTFELNCDSHPVNPDRCSQTSACSIRPVWQALQRRIDDLLESISVEDLLKQEPQVHELVALQPMT
jgi:Rrf2 family protein